MPSCSFFSNRSLPSHLTRKDNPTEQDMKDYVFKFCEAINPIDGNDIKAYLDNHVKNWNYLYNLNWEKIYRNSFNIHQKVKIWKGQCYSNFHPVFIRTPAEYIDEVKSRNVFPDTPTKFKNYVTALLSAKFDCSFLSIGWENALTSLTREAIKRDNVDAIKFSAALAFGCVETSYSDQLSSHHASAHRQGSWKVCSYLTELKRELNARAEKDCRLAI